MRQEQAELLGLPADADWDVIQGALLKEGAK